MTTRVSVAWRESLYTFHARALKPWNFTTWQRAYGELLFELDWSPERANRAINLRVTEPCRSVAYYSTLKKFYMTIMILASYLLSIPQTFSLSLYRNCKLTTKMSRGSFKSLLTNMELLRGEPLLFKENWMKSDLDLKLYDHWALIGSNGYCYVWLTFYCF